MPRETGGGNLLREGVRINEYGASRFNAKTVIIDDQWAPIGLANFDNRSFRINDETNVNVFDPDFAQMTIRVFEEDLDEATEYDHERRRDRSWTERARSIIGNLLGPHL